MTIRAYRVSEVAKMLSTSEDTLLREIRAGQLRTFKIGVQFRILHDDLESYIAEQRVPIDIPKPQGWKPRDRVAHPQLSEAGQRERAILEAGLQRKRERDAKRKAKQSILQTSERLKRRA